MVNSLGIFEDWIMPLFHLCTKMSWRGLNIDQAALGPLRDELKKKEELCEKTFTDMAGGVNPRSPKQVGQLLYEDLKLLVQRHRDTKKVSTDEDALRHLMKYHPHQILQVLLNYRSAHKDRSTYGDVVFDWDGKLRTKYSLTVTDTGRLSSRKTDFDTGFDIQNIPTWFRRVVVPSPGKVFVEADLRQAESRIVAWLAEDEEAMEIYNSGKNIHRWNAAKMFNMKYEDVEEKNEPGEPYYKAKKTQHAFNYRLGAIHAADIIGCTVAEAKLIKARNEKAFPKVVEWQKTIEEESHTNRLLITPLGRRRLFLGRQGDDLVRKMIAFVPQSTCVDYLNRGMLRVDRTLENRDAEILAQTHDGFLMECRKEEVEFHGAVIKSCCEQPMTINGRELIIPVKIRVGENWRDVE
jgi:DNA polymerase-1